MCIIFMYSHNIHSIFNSLTNPISAVYFPIPYIVLFSEYLNGSYTICYKFEKKFQEEKKENQP